MVCEEVFQLTPQHGSRLVPDVGEEGEGVEDCEAVQYRLTYSFSLSSSVIRKQKEEEA